MTIYMLQKDRPDSWSGELIEATKTDLELEHHLEALFERSPWALASEPLLWIGRQTAASNPEGITYPDLLGLDGEGNLVIVELKKGRTPRDVVAQILEYAAWANELSDESISDLAAEYLRSKGSNASNVAEAFRSTFEIDEIPPLNRGLRLFIVAEIIPPSVARVARFLRTNQGMDLNCVEASAYRTKSGEIVISIVQVVGQEDVVTPKRSVSPRWSSDKPVKQVVWEAVCELTEGDKARVFAPREVSAVIKEHYPDFKITNVNPELTADCVNHTSRHHYPGGKDRYWWLGRSQYRLFDPEVDRPSISPT